MFQLGRVIRTPVSSLCNQILSSRSKRTPFLAHTCAMLMTHAVVSEPVPAQQTKAETLEVDVLIRPADLSGSRHSRILRKNGRVPGLIYGVDENRNTLKIMVSIDQKVLLKELRLRGKTFENSLYRVNLKDENQNVLSTYLAVPRQAQFNPVTGLPVSVNFLKYSTGTKIRIPFEYINADLSVDLKRDCFIVSVNQFLECTCTDDVPPVIKLDLAEAKKGDVFRLNSLQLPSNVTPTSSVPSDFVVCVIKTATT